VIVYISVCGHLLGEKSDSFHDTVHLHAIFVGIVVFSRSQGVVNVSVCSAV
jgi:hypothetical protein